MEEKKFDSVRFVTVRTFPAVSQHLTPEENVHDAIDEVPLVRTNQNNEILNCNLTKIGSFTLNTQAVNDQYVFTKAHVAQFHNDNERSRGDLTRDFENE